MTRNHDQNTHNEQELRFQGVMSEDYLLVRKAVPGFDLFQILVADAVVACASASGSSLRVLDLGCGDGVTTAAILARRTDVHVTSLDNEQVMVARASQNLAAGIDQGRCKVVFHDALTYLGGLSESAFDVVASALALHNLHGPYRHALHRAIYKVLVPGGQFLNADKIARSDEQRWNRLRLTLNYFFDAFIPSGKLDLLRAAVMHEVGDEEPLRVIWEDKVVPELSGIGFRDVEVRRPHPLAALLVAYKPQ